MKIISKYLKNIFEEQELDKNLVVSKMEITADDGLIYKYDVTVSKNYLKEEMNNLIYFFNG